jgi:DmsE family decaheme c-type cytochrome
MNSDEPSDPAEVPAHTRHPDGVRGEGSWRVLPLEPVAPGLLVLGLLVLGLVACVARWSPPGQVGRHRTEPIDEAGVRIGASACFDCHASFPEHFAASEAHPDCESCHGAAQLHAYTARAADIRFPSSEDCASCHQVGSKTLLGWTTSPHARADVICSDCHDTHNRELWNLRPASQLEGTVLRHAGNTTRMCAACHPEVTAQLSLPSHHPLQEGMLECTDCHPPHESRRTVLGALTEQCVSCHQDAAGPWIYEHPPVTEDCGYCHAPHGTSADFLMEVSQPAACISCHSLPISGAVHQPYALTTACTDCHQAVHGSYADPHLRK